MKNNTLVILLVAVVLGIIGFVSWSMLAPKDTMKTTGTPTTSEKLAMPDQELTVDLMASPAGYEVWLMSDKEDIELSVFTLSIDFAPTTNSLSVTGTQASFPEDIAQSAWTFPISKITQNPDGSITADLAGTFAAPEPFDLSSKVHIATLPITSPQGAVAEISLNLENSEAYDKANQPVSIALTTKSME